MKRIALLLLCAPALVQAQSFSPESGWWWDEDHPGRGYTIEIQDDIVSFTAYLYDESGNPTWVSGFGELDGQMRMQGELYTAYDGRCVGCAYTEPSEANVYGEMRLDFTSSTSAELQLPGESVIDIERFNFVLGDSLQRVRGEWTNVTDITSEPDSSLPPYLGDVLIVDEIKQDAQGFYVAGCRPDTSGQDACSSDAVNQHPLAGDHNSNDSYSILVAEGNNVFTNYVLAIGLDEMRGCAQIYNSQTGDGEGVWYPVRGFRTASYSHILAEPGPGKQAPQARASSDRDRQRQRLAQSTQSKDTPIPSSCSGVVSKQSSSGLERLQERLEATLSE